MVENLGVANLIRTEGLSASFRDPETRNLRSDAIMRQEAHFSQQHKNFIEQKSQASVVELMAYL